MTLWLHSIRNIFGNISTTSVKVFESLMDIRCINRIICTFCNNERNIIDWRELNFTLVARTFILITPHFLFDFFMLNIRPLGN